MSWQNQKVWTWDIKKTESWNWLPSNINTQTKPVESPPTLESMIKKIQSHVEDQGFFNDMVEWLRTNAPKKLRNALRELAPPMHTGPVAYDRLCEVLYEIGFRASDLLERRMILGPTNRWVQEYFKDFPSRKSD